MSGQNVIKYLLYNLNNKVIKKQYSRTECSILSNLYLNYGCKPFDQMPYATSLINHNPKLSDLFECISYTDREHEFFARLIKNNTEKNGVLFTPKESIKGFNNIEELIDKYNRKLYLPRHNDRLLEFYGNHIYIKGYAEDSVMIIKKLQELSSFGITNYKNSVEFWLQFYPYSDICDEKKHILSHLFENSHVALINGSAGTGKSTLVDNISAFFNNMEKLYLTNTYPAKDNLQRKVKNKNSPFLTISKYLSSSTVNTSYDIIIIDECSTVSNSDMKKIIEKTTFTLLVLVGDVFQIESISFGNWFSIAKFFIPNCIFELSTPFRTADKNLLNVWNKVRLIDDSILESLVKNDYTSNLDESIFDISEEDQIILCLNYDGLYGINNINRFLQESNTNKPITWGINIYKINDPVLFNDSERFMPLIYNNLKGKIVDINKLDDRIVFDIEIDMVLNELEVKGYDFKLMGNSKSGKSIIRFYVNKYRGSDEDDLSSDTIVPFQIAYAVSIHKSQGLEYNSVKIVISTEIEELITHNIFYTAITRTKNKLKIYWSAETEKEILSNLKVKNGNKDAALLSSKYVL